MVRETHHCEYLGKGGGYTVGEMSSDLNAVVGLIRDMQCRRAEKEVGS